MALSRENTIRLKVLLNTRPRGWDMIAKAIIISDCYGDSADFVRTHIKLSQYADVEFDPDDPLGDKRTARAQYSLWPVGKNDGET